MDVDDVYFRKDGATCHRCGKTIGLLSEKFPGRVISRNGDYNWPPRSYDLTTLDFFLWGNVKDKVYADASQSIQDHKEKIRVVIDEIEPQMRENLMDNFIKRAWSCKRSRGDHTEKISVHRLHHLQYAGCTADLEQPLHRFRAYRCAKVRVKCCPLCAVQLVRRN